MVSEGSSGSFAADFVIEELIPTSWGILPQEYRTCQGLSCSSLNGKEIGAGGSGLRRVWSAGIRVKSSQVQRRHLGHPAEAHEYEYV